MDYEQRITKVETLMETLKADNDRLFSSIVELRHSIADLRDHTDQAIAGLCAHVDQGFAAERAYTDQRLLELREYMDRNFADIRKEASINVRWMVGLMLTNTSLIVGLYGKLFGLY